MPNHLSLLGIFHTAISILALLVGLLALLRNGKIIPRSSTGRSYIILTIITCLTAIPIMKTGHFTGAHGLAVIILLLLPIGIYAKSFKILGRLRDYLPLIIMSATLFLSFIPAIVETLTRLPISHPIAADANAPVIKTGLTILVTLFIIGVIYQIIKLRSRRKIIQTPGSSIKFS